MMETDLHVHVSGDIEHAVINNNTFSIHKLIITHTVYCTIIHVLQNRVYVHITSYNIGVIMYMYMYIHISEHR